jgi:hypothetical protein
LNFFEPASYFQRGINTEIYHQFENVMFRCICKNCKNGLWASSCLHGCSSVCLSVWNNSAPVGHIFIELECIKFNENLSKICQNNWSFTKLW